MTLDTAALAAHLGCTPGKVRLMVHEGLIRPLPRRVMLHRKGRPAMVFDVDQVEADIARAGDTARLT